MNLSVQCESCKKWSQVKLDCRFCAYCGNEYSFDINNFANRLEKRDAERAKTFPWTVFALFVPWLLSPLLFYNIGFRNEFILYLLPMLLGCFFGGLYLWRYERIEKSKLADLYSNPSIKIN